MSKAAKDEAQPALHIPLGFRVGGAFMAMALVLFIFAVISVFTDGFMAHFAVTPRFLLIVLAAAVLGAFATVHKEQEGSRAQVGALVCALGLIILGRFIPNEPLWFWAQYLLLGYAVLALVCGLIIRRSM